MKTSLLFALAGYLLAISAPAQNARPPRIVSPQIEDGQKVIFRLRAAKAAEVVLQGQWDKHPVPMARDADGVWSAVVPNTPAGIWEYSFTVDGLNVIDPGNPEIKPQREPGKSILHIPSTPPAPWDWQDVPHGTVHIHDYQSKALGRQREIWVYTPPGYENDSAKKYPLLVLQHGSGDNQQTWVQHGKANWILDNLIAEGKAHPMVIVMLDGHPLGTPSFQDPAKRGAAMEAFQRELFEDALPLVESLYRLEPGPANRAIAGLSMGGGQSLTVGLGNPDRFAWIGAFSAAPLGPEASEKFLADPAADNAKVRLLWIGVGKDDFLRQRNEDFVAALKEKGIHHEWVLSEGGHAWPVWREYLAEFAPLLFKDAK
jgi:enterochelin esterase-like enzyme